MPILQKQTAIALLAGLIVCLADCGHALAWKQVQDQWQEHYLLDHPDEDFVKLCRKKARCFVCHQGRKKKNTNPYGAMFVGKLVEEDKDDQEKIVKIIKEIGLLRSNAKDNESPSFDQLIAASKLPGGDLKAVRKEPKEPKETKTD